MMHIRSLLDLGSCRIIGAVFDREVRRIGILVACDEVLHRWTNRCINVLHKKTPDRRCGAAALPVCACKRNSFIVESDPHTSGEVWSIADEPCILVILRCACFAGCGEVEADRPNTCGSTGIDNVAERGCHHVANSWLENILEFRMRPINRLAVAVFDTYDGIRCCAYTFICKRAVSTRKLNRADFGGTKGDRWIWRNVRLDPKPLCHMRYVVQIRNIQQCMHRTQINRILQCLTDRAHTTDRFAFEVTG